MALALAAQHAAVDPKVILEDVRALIGQMQEVRITEALPHSLRGEMLSVNGKRDDRA